MAEDWFARLRNASLALKFSISIGDVTINYDGVLDACSEVERLRGLLRRLVLNAPGAFRGAEPDTGQYNEWFTAIREAAEAAKEKS